MLFRMLWGQHDCVQVLLHYAKHQRELHQTEAFETKTQQYREWLTKATKQGGRGLYRTLKKEAEPYT